MIVSKILFQDAVPVNHQYAVPLFQRPYTWSEPNWKMLWDDLCEACEAPLAATHFFGSIVTKREAVPLGSVNMLLLIDGQQRLTTCILLLAVLRDEARRLGQEDSACEIEDYFLFNRRKEDTDRYKLWPTKSDRATWYAIMNPDAQSESALSSMKGKMAESARYFRRCLQRSNAPALADLKNALLSRFELVHIQLDPEDDPHRIFESLNAKNERLNEADLLRNYFLMRLPVNEQEKHYHAHWEPMDAALKTDLPEFVRHYLSRRGKLVKKGDVYREVRAAVEKLQPAEVVLYLREMARSAEFYSRFLNPELESSAEVRRALTRLSKLEVTIAYPFLLEVFASRGRGELGDAQVREILEWIENIVLRRWVAGMIRSELNKVFSSLWQQSVIRSEGNSALLVQGVKQSLATLNYPRDQEFGLLLATKPIYKRGQGQNKAAVILERLEESFAHKEAVQTAALTVEHIMPQTLNQQWKKQLGADWEQTYDLWLDTLGNLTLTGYNSELSNQTFERKQPQYEKSHVELSREVAQQQQWGEAQIRARGEALAQRALQVWPSLVDEGAQDLTLKRDVRNQRPIKLVLPGEERAVESWREAAQWTLEAVAEISPDGFAIFAHNCSHLIKESKEGLRSPRLLSNGYWMETQLNATALYRMAEQAAQSAGLANSEWEIVYEPSKA